MTTYPTSLGHPVTIEPPDTNLHSVSDSGYQAQTAYQERPTTTTYDAAFAKYHEYTVQAMETFRRRRTRIDKVDSDFEEAWGRVRQVDGALIEDYRRRELIRQGKLINAQLEADLEHWLRIYVEMRSYSRRREFASRTWRPVWQDLPAGRLWDCLPFLGTIHEDNRIPIVTELL
ncbi:hypothetical protein BC834DRAFT_843434 [Gloeopeniophorella convolvens]|nr:hypothetical protein BC834DRAFT_843434 [Gloeopeniophorella convolvens]